MLLPLQSLAAPITPITPDQLALCHDPAAILEYISDPAPSICLDPYHATILLSRLFQEYLPPSSIVQQKLTLLAWRVEPPSRVVLYTGPANPNIDDLPHTRPKLLLDERSRRQDPSAIHLIPGTSVGVEPASHVRSAILRHAQGELVPYYDSVSVAKHQATKTLVISHSLEEAMACFIHAPTKNHSTVGLNQSPVWNKDHIDSRYTETQTASNGMRYRDWLCVHANERGVEKCKLDSHILDISRYYQTRIPWKRSTDASGGLEWALVRSSLPLDSRVLRDTTSTTTGNDVDRFMAFTRAVKSRFLQDLKLLPVLDPDAHTVQRVNTSVYTDEPSQQVLILYAPESSSSDADGTLDKLQFISFSLLPCSP